MSHPSVCPKCKYNRPIALSYCPHCRDLDSNSKENARKETISKFNSILKISKQEKQENPNVKKTDKLKRLQGTRNKTVKRAKKPSRTTKTKRKLKNRV